MTREAKVERKTSETDISLSIKLSGSGTSKISTGIGFFDHMLTLFTRHGLFEMELNCKGDLEVDAHHTVEDIGIVMGQAFKEALGEKKSIKRYGNAFVPMDESLAMVSIDLSGRPFLVCDLPFTNNKTGDMDSELFEEFFRAFSNSCAVTLHVKLFYGSNNHHIAEAAFKAFARALSEAVSIDSRIDGVMSTKGVL